MSPISSRKATMVFAKAPRPGEVKTRLIPLLGAQGAAALQARLTKHTLATASVAARDALELHGDLVEDEFLRFCAARYNASLVPQQGRDLGERMYHAFERALSSEACASAVLIGTDCPALTPRHIRLAFQALHNGHDAVLAPAEDGGYVLLGLARADVRLFEDITWGTDRVVGLTRARLRVLGWRWLELETLWDVDRIADWHRLGRSDLLGSNARTAQVDRCEAADWNPGSVSGSD
ncbi:MAG: TIGR04282 family arsenosugar biosynthesis glycosyltransferase [Burkholderiales bacterium]